MHRSFKIILLFVIALVAVLLLRPNPSAAGDIILTHNRGGENAVFFVNDEPSLVINGFDLSPHTTRFPIALDAVSISVDRPAPGSRIDLVVYQDANGGSPVDASLVHRQSVQINRRGVQRFILNEAAIITEPVVWVGFYLPVGFRFHADTSGPSVLTYWAWAPGGTFPLDNLASAPVLGPGDGAEPVSIDMQGVARITAELRPLFHQEMASDAVLGNQLIAEGEQDTSLLQGYPDCGGLLFDPEDIAITSRASFTVHCGIASEFEAPTEVVHPDGHFLDLQRAGHLYKLEAQIPQAQLVHGAVNVMPVPVTHCIQIQAGHLEQAVIAEARGIPERWHALPSVRFEDVVCAEITTASYLSYFLPRGADAPPNVNLVMGWSKVSPHPLECGLPAYVEAPVTNTGQSWFSTVSGNVKFIIENIHVRSGITTGAVELSIETSQLGPGMRHILVFAPIYVTTYVNELHRLQVRADFDNQIQETNENDNVWFTEYILSNAQQSDRCFDAPWLTATPTAPYLVEGFCFVDLPRRDSGGKIVIRYSDSCQIDEFRQGRMVEESGDWQHTLRGCDILVRTEVDGQDVRVRWSSRQSPGEREVEVIIRTPGVEETRVWECAAGSFHQYRETVEVGGEKVRQLVIDHDRPPGYEGTATTVKATANAVGTSTYRDNFTPHPQIPAPQLTVTYDPILKLVKLSWPSMPAAKYDIEYGDARHIVLTPVEVTVNKYDVPVRQVIRGVDYEWRVQALRDVDGDDVLEKGAWGIVTTEVPPLPAPASLSVENIPFEGIKPSNKFRFSWSEIGEGGTPVPRYEFRYREQGESSWEPTVVATTSHTIDVGAGNKHKTYEWQVRAENGGPWAQDTFNFSAVDLTATADYQITQTATRIPTPMNMMARRSSSPPRIAFSWDGIDDVSRYEFQWRLSSANLPYTWLPSTPVAITNPSHIHPIEGANIRDRHTGRVRAVIGLAQGQWEETEEPVLRNLVKSLDLQLLSDTSNSVKFVWLKVNEATHYEYRYRYSDGGTWNTKRVPASVEPIQQSGGLEYHGASEEVGTSNIGMTFQWQVRAIKNLGQGHDIEGPWSDLASGTPSSVSNRFASNARMTSTDGVDYRLSWSGVGLGFAGSYEVLYREVGGDWNPIISSLGCCFIASGTGDFILTVGTNYQLYVRPVESDGRKGQWIGPVSARR